MKAAIVCFSETGRKTALRVADSLSASGSCELYIKTKYAVEDERFTNITDRLPQWTREHWTEDLLVFVGAIGIAVRGIASSVNSGKTDPAVVVLDEMAKYCIPLLSGHLGRRKWLCSGNGRIYGQYSCRDDSNRYTCPVCGRCLRKEKRTCHRQYGTGKRGAVPRFWPDIRSVYTVNCPLQMRTCQKGLWQYSQKKTLPACSWGSVSAYIQKRCLHIHCIWFQGFYALAWDVGGIHQKNGWMLCLPEYWNKTVWIAVHLPVCPV